MNSESHVVGLTEKAAARVVEDARIWADLREVESVVTVEKGNGVLGARLSTIVSSSGMATQIEGMQTQCRCSSSVDIAATNLRNPTKDAHTPITQLNVEL